MVLSLNISNQKIIVILTIALIISIAGTIINVKILNKINYDSLTILATDTGTGLASITIASQTALDNQVTSIAFGSGFVNGSCSSCVMDSDGKQNQTGRCCRDFTNVSSGFLLENTGSDNMSVNYSCSGSCTATTFIGGSAPRFEIRVSSNSVELQSGETGTIDSQTSCNSSLGGGGWNFTNNSNRFSEKIYIAMQSTAWLCGNSSSYPLDSATSSDAVVVDINVSIPSDAPGGSGQQTATFTFTGQSTG